MMTLSTVSPYQRTLAAVGTPSETLQLISEGYTNEEISKTYEENDESFGKCDESYACVTVICNESDGFVPIQ